MQKYFQISICCNSPSLLAETCYEVQAGWIQSLNKVNAEREKCYVFYVCPTHNTAISEVVL